MASIQKRNGRYHVRVRRQNFLSQCKSFQYKVDALKWAADTERAIDTNQLFNGLDYTVAELLERYGAEITPKKQSAEIEQYRIDKLTGTYTYADGSKHVGEFRDGKAHGQGTRTYAGGNKYVGEWKDGERHETGTKLCLCSLRCRAA